MIKSLLEREDLWGHSIVATHCTRNAKTRVRFPMTPPISYFILLSLYLLTVGETTHHKQLTFKKGKKYMTTIIVGVVALVGGFVFGVLFGRKNKAIVEKELADVKAAAAKAGVKL